MKIHVGRQQRHKLLRMVLHLYELRYEKTGLRGF